MGDIEVRPVREDEVPNYMRCISTAFFIEPKVDDESLGFWRERLDDLSRRHAGFIDGVLAGTAGAFATELTVPGGTTVPMAAVTGVTVLPTHRRRGVLRQMMEVQLADAVDRGEVAAMLVAAEWPIYGRYGYGMAAEPASTELDARTARFLPTSRDDAGTLEVVTVAKLRELAPPVFDAHRLTVAGPIARDPFTWDLVTGLRVRPGDSPPAGKVGVVHRDASGAIDAYAQYRAHDQWIDNRPSVTVDIDELLTTNEVAYRELWSYLANIDWVVKVNAHVRPVDEPLRFLLEDGRAAVQRDRSDHMWVRILDIRRALEARAYEAPVDLVVEVHDAPLGLGGRWRLEADPTGASATPTARDADVALGIDALGGAYLGGTPLSWFARAGRVNERTPGAAATLETALRTRVAPWATTNF